jgi:hypothetical protein
MKNLKSFDNFINENSNDEVMKLVQDIYKEYPDTKDVKGSSFKVIFRTDPEDDDETVTVSAGSALEAVVKVWSENYDIDIDDVDSWEQDGQWLRFRMDDTGDPFHIFKARVKKIK